MVLQAEKYRAVPVALLNMQKSPVWGFVPDAWHHQMIYACDSNFIYLTNPLESKSVESIMNELTSESILLVRSNDVVKRFVANKVNLIDLLVLKNYSNEEKKRWYDMNVLGQVLNVLREHKVYCENLSYNFLKQNDYQESLNQASFIDISPFDISDVRNENNMVSIKNQNQTNTNQNSTSNWSHMTHISIPAAYKAGITLFAHRNSELFNEILSEMELPNRK
ncbi:dentin sialophospho -like isoform X3 [Brachionus plicatilis]|uniref:Dentin sialophospho-like isoform X3 n=1 Tax=Brachionus plicatilis TaxID=10195 RepID=A0A3M7RIS1_BRAPC|nr:dentin sialophospho -like isoform X3 [Brachionus plicatilis]